MADLYTHRNIVMPTTNNQLATSYGTIVLLRRKPRKLVLCPAVKWLRIAARQVPAKLLHLPSALHQQHLEVQRRQPKYKWGSPGALVGLRQGNHPLWPSDGRRFGEPRLNKPSDRQTVRHDSPNCLTSDLSV